MTIPYISAPAWSPRPRAVIAPVPAAPRGAGRRPPKARPAPPREHAVPRSAIRRIAWLDVVVQVVVGALVVALAWAIVTSGLFTRAVDSFTGWYLGDIAPTYSTGFGAVIPAQEFRAGFFAPRPEAPDALRRPGLSYLTVAEISATVEAAAAS